MHKVRLGLALTLLLALGGCGVQSLPISNSGLVTTAQVAGRAMGGQQPVSGATVSLYAPGITGYGSAPTLLSTTTTDGGGNFTLPGYVCPAVDTITYLLVLGGNPGSGVNTAVGEAAVLPNCSQLRPSTFIIVSEVTTVAAAYALSPFASSYSAIGTSATNITGLNNAGGSAAILANYATGSPHAAGDLTGVVPPTAYVVTLADILAACVNSSNASSTQCTTLMSDAGSGSPAATNTFQAALNIAQSPASNVTPLFSLAASNPPYAGALSSAPTDFSLAIGYNAGTISTAGSGGVAIDATGNAWIVTGSFPSAVYEISPAGAYLSTTFGNTTLTNSYGIAFDQSGNVYVANKGFAHYSSQIGQDVYKFLANGTLTNTYGTFYYSPSYSDPTYVAIDGSGNTWIDNSGAAYPEDVTEINALTQTASTVFTPFNSTYAAGFCIDLKAVFHVSNGGGLYRFATATNALTSVTVPSAAAADGSQPTGCDIDASGNVWVADNAFDYPAIDKFSDALVPLGRYVPNSAVQPDDLAIDGLGHVWSSAGIITSQTQVPNTPGALIEYSSAGTLLSPTLGFKGSSVIPPGPNSVQGMAIDGSGNIWITGTNNSASLNASTTTIYANNVAEIVGIAAPVVTPRATAISRNALASRP